MGRERLAHVGFPPQQTTAESRRKAVIGILFMAAVSGAVGVLFFGPKSIVDNKVWIMIGALAVFLVWLFVELLKPEEKKPVVVLVVLVLFSIVYWSGYE